MYGRTFPGIFPTVLIDAEVRIARVWRHVKSTAMPDQVLRPRGRADRRVILRNLTI